jgi:uncharacterized protein YehS (DUF1456 family)
MLLGVNHVNFVVKMANKDLIRVAIHPQDSKVALKHVRYFIQKLKSEGYHFCYMHELFKSVERLKKL